MKTLSVKNSIFWISICALLPAWALFSQTVSGGDNEAHIKFVQHALKTGKYPPHFLYHILLNIFSGFNGDRKTLCHVSAIILSLSVGIKLFLSLHIINHLALRIHKQLSLKALIGFGGTLFIIGPIINWWQFPIIYKGQFTPNIWHNPTSVLLMPFAVAIILILIKENNKQSFSKILIAALLLALSTLIKPNFSLIMIPTAIIFFLTKQLNFRKTLIFIIPSILILAWQFAQNYTDAGTMTITHHKSSIIFNPLAVWKSWSATLYGSFLVSFAFPITFIYLFFNKIKNKKFFWLSITLTVISFILFIFFSETGDKMRHGNFFWGTIPALYFLFMTCISELFFLKPSNSDSKTLIKIKICYAILILHILSGIMFYARTLLGNSFYA